MGRSRWFLENPYDEAFVRAEDKELWCRTALRSRFRVLPEPLLFYRQPDRINLRSYVASCRTLRRVFVRYGPDAVGKRGTAALLAASWVKELGHRVAHVVGLDGLVLGLWAAAPGHVPADDVASALARAISAPVPGWPERSPR